MRAARGHGEQISNPCHGILKQHGRNKAQSRGFLGAGVGKRGEGLLDSKRGACITSDGWRIQKANTSNTSALNPSKSFIITSVH